MKIIITESQLKRLLETRVVGSYLRDFEPIKDTEKIRVYHGFNSSSKSYALHSLTHGLSGGVRAPRIYSYETGNNPKGLFVSTEFKLVAKNFASSGIIIEFETKVTNLEAPVWAGQDSFFVPGQMTKSFKNDDERQQEILRKRKEYGEKDPEGEYGKNRVSKSDRPELGDSIFNNPEHQALFIGDLNPNEIKTVWFHEGRFFRRNTEGPWIRYSRRDFLKKYGNELKSEEVPETLRNKLFKPNDDLMSSRLEEICKEYGMDKEELLDIFKSEQHFLWPKQIKQLEQL